MEVLIKETGKREELSMRNPETGIDCSADFIGNTGVFYTSEFPFDEEEDIFVVTQETFDWWKNIIEQYQEMEDRIEDLVKEHGAEKVYNVINNVHSEFEDAAKDIIGELDEHFGKTKNLSP